MSFPYKRVVVVGVTSSGKSTLAEKLAKRFDLDYIELDALNWEPNWQAAPLGVFRARVENATQSEKWIVAGNYHTVRDLIWPRAEAIIWLDYPFLTVLGQLTRPTSGAGGPGNCSGERTANPFGFISNFGRQIHCTTGCFKRTGEESVNTRCCCLSRSTST